MATGKEMAMELDEWKQMRMLTLPRGQKQEQQFQFVCVNGRTFQVPKGKAVEVPLPIYQCIMESQAAEEFAFQADRAETPK